MYDMSLPSSSCRIWNGNEQQVSASSPFWMNSKVVTEPTTTFPLLNGFRAIFEQFASLLSALQGGYGVFYKPDFIHLNGCPSANLRVKISLLQLR